MVNRYYPDYVSPPGETLRDILEDRNITCTELARRMGRPEKTISEILGGKAKITPSTAIELELVLNTPASFWNNLEKNYQEYLARKRWIQYVEDFKPWIKNFKFYNELSKRGFVKPYNNQSEKLIELLKFFSIKSPDSWQITNASSNPVYRKTEAFESNDYAISAWLRMGEIEAEQIKCKPYDKKKFLTALNAIRELTIQTPDNFSPSMVELCAKSGVAVVFQKQLPGARLSGATLWLNPKKALIQLSLRYKTNDHFWFSFFHEAGHILRHAKKNVYLDTMNKDIRDPEETQADEFASNFLIPKHEYQRFITNRNFNESMVILFSEEINIDPGIIVGRLQHDKFLNWNQLNHLKTQFVWDED